MILETCDPVARRESVLKVLLFVFVLCAMVLAQMLDDEQRTAERIEEDRQQAEIDAQFEARIERAARDACADAVGPGSLPSWAEPGKLVCLPPLSMPIAMGGAQ